MPSYTFTENSTSQNSSDTPTTSVTEDTGLTEAEPTTNQDQFGAYEASRFGGGDHNNIIIRFDTSSIVDSETITSATLHLYHTNNNSESHTINVYEVLQNSWTEGGATWNTYDGTNNWNTGGCRGSGSDRASSTTGSAVVNTTTGEYKSWSLNVADISKTGDSEFLVEMDAGEGQSGDVSQYTKSEGTDGQRPELVVVTTTGSSGAATFPYQMRRYMPLLIR